MAKSLLSGERKAVLLGNSATSHPQASLVRAWADWIGRATGATVGVLTDAANTVGGYLARACPQAEGLDARQMVEQPRKAYLLWNVEPEYDVADPAATMRALQAADSVIAFSMYRNGALDYADVILPIAPFTETAGTFVNCEGRVQTFNGAVRPAGDARPGWKVLRVLGNLLQLEGFGYESPEEVRREAIADDVSPRLARQAAVTGAPAVASSPDHGAERLADVPLYSSDAIVRRSAPLQQTRQASPPKARANAKTLQSFELVAGDKARVGQGDASALLEVALDNSVADGVVQVSAGHESTAMLGPMFGPITLRRA